ncbi:imidazole glycerol phosphate synthase subunit HisH [Tessaracoccus sp. SD287]|uniref:imidazole glycerol phosphate synthase subunit HisH n=1 Tax=Tessaracoccus sp. SD287 TaxID=2782008 RepID=UPI001A96159D|nr:imidazole glycerol phosphate synthase subunit HisH [Tessaracoccus sp. SD287]
MPEHGVPVIGVLDYGSGNLHSAVKALEAAGARVILGSADEIADCDGVLIPGVGAFAACMDGLEAARGDVLVRERLAAGRPVLGICVGHQVMFAAGHEHGVDRAGIGVLPGTVDRLDSPRLPHMGWNTVEPAPGSRLFTEPGERYYFVHSYAVRELPAGFTGAVTWAEHQGDRFVAAVEDGALTCVQFHPEKSGAAGGRLLRRWLAAVEAAR